MTGWMHRCAKARTTPLPRTGASALGKSGEGGITPHSAPKVPSEKIEPLKNCARLRFEAQSSLANTCAAVMANARGVALFALAALHWYQGLAYQSLAMHLSMAC